MSKIEERFALIADNGDRLHPYKKSQVSTGRYGFALTSPGEQDRHGGGTYVDDIETVVKRMVFDGWSARVTTTNKKGRQREGTLGIGKRSIVGYELDEELEPLIRSASTQPRRIIRRTLDNSAIAGEDDTSGKNGESKNTVDEVTLQAIKTRRGQPEFRKSLIAAYQGQCCVTGCAVESVLEAAHIIPHAQESDYKVTNGLLLRADIHTLYDLNHVVAKYFCPQF